MSNVIAFAGKGGVGKTAVSACLIRHLVSRGGGSVLAVDADPNHNLGMALGVRIDRTVADLREDMAAGTLSTPAGMNKERMIEYGVQAAVEEHDGFALLVMGRPEGPGCYCYVNHVLRRVLEELRDSYDWVVIDTEAGMEHLSRRTTGNVDLMVVVCQPTAASVLAAERIAEMAGKLPVNVERIAVVFNMVHDGVPPRLIERIKGINLDVMGEVPYNPSFDGCDEDASSDDICPWFERVCERIVGEMGGGDRHGPVRADSA